MSSHSFLDKDGLRHFLDKVKAAYSGNATAGSTFTVGQATKALQDGSGNVITSTYVKAETGKRLMTDAEGTKLEGIAEGAQVNVIETIKIDDAQQTVSSKVCTLDLSAYAKTASLGAAAYAAIANNVTTTTEGSVLDARQGKILADRISDLGSIGRYLSLWYSDTGLPSDDPPEWALVEGAYPYKTGDYYIIGKVSSATPAVNYKPSGSSYTPGTASTVGETEDVNIGDFYLYDGTNWKLMRSTQRTITIAQVQGLQTALDAKVDTTRKVNEKALSADITLNGADVKLDGYVKPSSAGAVEATDTVNDAIGKLEKRIDQAVAGGVSDVTVDGTTIVENTVAKLGTVKNSEIDDLFA